MPGAGAGAGAGAATQRPGRTLSLQAELARKIALGRPPARPLWAPPGGGLKGPGEPLPPTLGLVATKLLAEQNFGKQ